MKQFFSKSESETKQIAAKLARQISSGVIALNGELGAGKTIFAQGFAKGLGIKEKIISPTFVLIRQHKIPKTDRIFYHIDLYRLQDSHGFKNLGIKDLLNNPKNLILIEWAEKIEKYLPKNIIKVSIKIMNDNQREIEINNL